jgi:hypothetical protein
MKWLREKEKEKAHTHTFTRKKKETRKLDTSNKQQEQHWRQAARREIKI